MYMSELGRWGVSDPLTAIAPGISPYAYCYNNPINYVDPTGMFGEEYEQGGYFGDMVPGISVIPCHFLRGQKY
jgi:hypothetical protein